MIFFWAAPAAVSSNSCNPWSIALPTLIISNKGPASIIFVKPAFTFGNKSTSVGNTELSSTDSCVVSLGTLFILSPWSTSHVLLSASV